MAFSMPVVDDALMTYSPPCTTPAIWLVEPLVLPPVANVGNENVTGSPGSQSGDVKDNAEAKPFHQPLSLSIMALNALDMPSHIPLAALAIAPGMPLTKSTTFPKADLIPSQTALAPAVMLVKIPLMTSQAAPNAILMPSQAILRYSVNPDHIFWPSSVLVKNSTRPATTAAMAATIRPIGLAMSAAFHRICALVAIPAAVEIAVAPADARVAAPLTPSRSGVTVLSAPLSASSPGAAQESSPPRSCLVVSSAPLTPPMVSRIPAAALPIVPPATARPPATLLATATPMSVPVLATPTALVSPLMTALPAASRRSLPIASAIPIAMPDPSAAPAT